MNTPADFTKAYKTAVYERSVDSFVALYDPEVQVFDMWGQWELRGVEAWHKMATEWFSSLGNERVVVDFENTTLKQTSDMAYINSFVRYAGHDAEGKELRSMHNRMTAVLQKRGDTWKVTHEHTSAPIDHETLKAKLQK